LPLAGAPSGARPSSSSRRRGSHHRTGNGTRRQARRHDRPSSGDRGCGPPEGRCANVQFTAGATSAGHAAGRGRACPATV
jgi:hypothetical protein